jgi:hypothetical protein
MELQPGNIDAFIRHCIWNAENDRRTSIDNFSDVSRDDEQNSLYDQYINKDDDTFQDVQSFVSSTNTTNTPSLCSENNTETSSFNESDEDINTTTTSIESNVTNNIYLNGDSSPKSFLQLSGIVICIVQVYTTPLVGLIERKGRAALTALTHIGPPATPGNNFCSGAPC